MTPPTLYQGAVTALGPKHVVRAAVLVENYGYIVFDTDGPREVEPGDLITGLARSNGSQTVRNQTQGRSLRIHVETFDATLLSAKTLLHYG
jgi:hypothetical protein